MLVALGLLQQRRWVGGWVGGGGVVWCNGRQRFQVAKSIPNVTGVCSVCGACGACCACGQEGRTARKDSVARAAVEEGGEGVDDGVGEGVGEGDGEGDDEGSSEGGDDAV